jgi:hypothetical protein
MIDTSLTSVVLVSLEASSLEGAWLTSNDSPVVSGGRTYVSVPSMDIAEISNKGDLSDNEVKIDGVPILPGFLSLIAGHMPYSKVEVKIIEVVGGIVTNHYRGLLYQAEPEYGTGYIRLICKELKYYTDITAGIPCTEQCAVLYFGDKLCGKAVYTESHTVESVDGVNLTIAADLNNTTPFLFNKGYIEKGAVRLKIKYHESGRVFQMSQYAPAAWIGSQVAIYAGCDRRIQTCRTVHNNEARFMGLGYSMVDYNALYESP